jgi:DNA-binding protein YbaB
MNTITLKINEKTKKGKAFLEMVYIFFENSKEIERIEEEESLYNKEFVEMIEKSHSSKNRTLVTSKNLWESF